MTVATDVLFAVGLAFWVLGGLMLSAGVYNGRSDERAAGVSVWLVALTSVVLAAGLRWWPW